MKYSNGGLKSKKRQTMKDVFQRYQNRYFVLDYLKINTKKGLICYLKLMAVC